MSAQASPTAWRGRSAEVWAAEIGVPFLELHVVLPSTNARLRELARQGFPPFSTIVAGEQTSGRGRQGRAWHSPPESGLWLSVLLSLETVETVGVLPLAVGVAVAASIEQCTGTAAALKWPNDILVGSKKVAGILCESAADSGDLVAVGIGINLRRPREGVPSKLEATAGFLDELVNRSTSEPALAKAIVAELRSWAQPTPPSLEGRLRLEWEARDHLRDRKVRLDSGAVGVALGVSSDGALKVAVPSQPVLTVRSGSVRLEEEDVR